MSAKKWLTTLYCLLLAFLVVTGALVVWIDPFFHYHGPVGGFYYQLGDQRSQNDGITRHFDYDAVITGTSMAENFRTSEFDALFGTHAVKLPYPGATYKEINDNLEKALDTHPDVTYVLRPLDLTHLIEDASAMRTDMGDYPDYLYDNNILNDVKYLYNSTVLFEYAAPMLAKRALGEEGGITPFDDYSWSGDDEYSAEKALEGKTSFTPARSQPGLTEEEKQMVEDNIEANVVRTAREHPKTIFLYYFAPYSAAYYGKCMEDGTFEKLEEAEQLATKAILACDNIRLFLFSSDTDTTMNLANYKDMGHYSPEVSSLILERLHLAVTGEEASLYEMTRESADDLLTREREIYESFDFNSLVAEASSR